MPEPRQKSRDESGRRSPTRGRGPYNEWTWPIGDRTDWTRSAHAEPMARNPYVEDDERSSRVLLGPRGEVLRNFSERPIVPFGFQGRERG